MKTQKTDLVTTGEPDFSFIERAEERKAVKSLTEKLYASMETSLKSVIEIGKHLSCIKNILPHGEYMTFIERCFPWTHPDRYINGFKAFGHLSNSPTSVNLPFDKEAVLLLGAPSVPKAAKEEAVDRAAKGEKITHKVAKEIKEKHTEPKEKEAPPVPPTPPTPPAPPVTEAPKRKWPWEKDPINEEAVKEMRRDMDTVFEKTWALAQVSGVGRPMFVALIETSLRVVLDGPIQEKAA